MTNIAYEVYDSNSDRLLGIASVTLPDFSLMTAEVKGAGILGQMDWPIFAQAENLEMTFNFRVLYEDATRFMFPNAHTFTLRSAYEKYDAADGTRQMRGLKIFVRGLTKGTNLGKLETAESADVELTLHLDYIKIEEAGKVILEFDRFNYVFSTGEDLMGDLKSVLGL